MWLSHKGEGGIPQGNHEQVLQLATAGRKWLPVFLLLFSIRLRHADINMLSVEGYMMGEAGRWVAWTWIGSCSVTDAGLVEGWWPAHGLVFPARQGAAASGSSKQPGAIIMWKRPRNPVRGPPMIKM